MSKVANMLADETFMEQLLTNDENQGEDEKPSKKK